MTRINLTCPHELSDSHLFTEVRELPRIFTMTLSAQNRGLTPDTYDIPEAYTLGAGHMKFFADKLGFLLDRFHSLVAECKHRGINLSFTEIHPERINALEPHWFGTYEPTIEAIQISRLRIMERIAANPNHHRWTRRNLDYAI